MVFFSGNMRIFLIFIALSLQAKPLNVSVTAHSAIVMNADTGAILFEKQAYVPAYPASITKIATALYILDQKKPLMNQMVTVSGEALKMKNPKNLKEAPSYWQESDGSSMRILKGEVLSVEALLHGLMLVSGNDAANALAVFLSGSVPAFLEEMNAYIRNLGCKNTQFSNPHGLHHPEHFTTAYDICLITKKALQIPKFREIVSKETYLKPKTNKQPQGEIENFNSLIKPGRHYYSKAIGVKTGFHSAAKSTLVAAAEHEGRTLIAVLLGCEKKASRYVEATRLFEAAFAEQKEKRRLLGPENIFTQEVPGSKTLLHAALTKELAIEFFPAEEPECKAALHWNFPPLPIRKGQKVGEIRVLDAEQRLLQKGDLIALQEIKGSFLLTLREMFVKFFE